ncbi:hypothetical protein BH09PSE3_BH09PSE3_09790 [soil metagenome]
MTNAPDPFRFTEPGASAGYVSNEDDPVLGRMAAPAAMANACELRSVHGDMVARAFTAFATLLIGVAAPSSACAQKNSQGARIEAVARATIIRPAVLRVAGPSRSFLTSAGYGGIKPRTSTRPCTTDGQAPCRMIVFDLP